MQRLRMPLPPLGFLCFRQPLMTRQADEAKYDPVFLNSRREAKVIFCFWLAGLLWCVPCCYLLGFREQDPESLSLIMGMPSWLVWGIGIPWLVADLATMWFCFFFMKDDELDKVEGESE